MGKVKNNPVCNKKSKAVDKKNAFSGANAKQDKNTRFFCDKCHKSFKTVSAANDHGFSKHLLKDEAQCDLCGEYFESNKREDCWGHFQKHTSIKKSAYF